MPWAGRTWMIAVICLLCTLLLAACTRPRWPRTWLLPFGSDSEPRGQANTAPAVRFFAWQGTAEENDFLTAALASYARSSTPVQIEYHFVDDFHSTLLTALDSSAPPDVFWVPGSMLSKLVEDDYLDPIPDSVRQERTMFGAPANAFMRQGAAYCLPRELFPQAVLFNKRLFDDAGLAYPSAGWRWSDLIDTAVLLTDTDIGRYGLVLPMELSRLVTFAHQAGVAIPPGPLQIRDWDQTALVMAIEFYLDLFRSGATVVPASLNSTWTGDALGRGAVALTIEASWILPYLQREYPDTEYGVVSLPKGPANNDALAYSSCVAVNEHAVSPTFAHGLAAHLVAPEHVLDWGRLTGSLPPQRDLAQIWLSTYPQAGPFVEAVERAHSWRWHEDDVATLNTIIETAVNNEWSARELYSRLVESTPSVEQ